MNRKADHQAFSDLAGACGDREGSGAGFTSYGLWF